jgi:hypothetical protein
MAQMRLVSTSTCALATSTLPSTTHEDEGIIAHRQHTATRNTQHCHLPERLWRMAKFCQKRGYIDA